MSLRGLGVSSTLVLIDGLRSANFPLNDDGHNAYVDLNSIPFSTIDRIEGDMAVVDIGGTTYDIPVAVLQALGIKPEEGGSLIRQAALPEHVDL